MPEEREDINELIRRCLRNDERAWETLHGTYRSITKSHVIGILKSHNCLSYLDNHLDSIVSYIFEELFIYLPKYNFSNFDTWFWRLRVSKTFDYIRREIRYTKKEKAYRLARADADIGTEDEESRLLRKEIRSAVDLLPPEYAIPLKLFYFEGLSYNEIAHSLRMQPFAVGMRITRAKRKLRSMLEAE